MHPLASPGVRQAGRRRRDLVHLGSEGHMAWVTSPRTPALLPRQLGSPVGPLAGSLDPPSATRRDPGSLSKKGVDPRLRPW